MGSVNPGGAKAQTIAKTPSAGTKLVPMLGALSAQAQSVLKHPTPPADLLSATPPPPQGPGITGKPIVANPAPADATLTATFSKYRSGGAPAIGARADFRGNWFNGVAFVR